MNRYLHHMSKILPSLSQPYRLQGTDCEYQGHCPGLVQFQPFRLREGLHLSLKGWDSASPGQRPGLNLKTAVRDGKVMQDFDLKSLLIGGAHSQMVKGPPNGSDSGSKDCVNLPSPTAVFRLKNQKTLSAACSAATNLMAGDP